MDSGTDRPPQHGAPLRVLLLNQTFHPDVVSSAQHLTDLAVALVRHGYDVDVITGDRGYDDHSLRFARHERWNGIDITRIPRTEFGKGARWRRALDFGSYLLSLALSLCLRRRYDVVVAMTSPPLISSLGALFCQLKGGRFVFWVMDLNPDEAVAAGWLQPDSLAARVLQWLLRYSVHSADRVIVLDDFMKEVVQRKNVPSSRIDVIAPWSHDDDVCYDEAGRRSFRKEHDLEGRFVVMYAGNHSPCNPLDTVLEAAAALRHDQEVVFCFVGGGSEYTKLKRIAGDRGLQNVRFVPYQPRTRLAATLSAADLHVVVMGDPFVGLIHPCKIYNVLRVHSPILYVGPSQSHIGNILADENGLAPVWRARHGRVEEVKAAIDDARRRTTGQVRKPNDRGVEEFTGKVLVPRMIASIDPFGTPERATAQAALVTARNLD